MRLKRRVTGLGMSPEVEDYFGTMEWVRGVGPSVVKLGGWWTCPIATWKAIEAFVVGPSKEPR
ncbi:BZ3500_MvSof-1268-A1-R1_Chr1-3g01680 [Microbotryum saponariae]|uniref:BZ3500_MvSof-1268-A1-R1_Chr1-3g01680 protein n=1 Tax=Microbotryum saponariae TaxID=289078 RepID=A0A2X0MF38_9BASI|nr:BZ3500_MvSof-1268-A1-R1_Chr1-3g01680 [Microbotryum saponariae]SCZ94306.1 BZ3501_MvSof-1269-A2-R1_Chr1-3g01281 [Microbotryum saponariae]